MIRRTRGRDELRNWVGRIAMSREQIADRFVISEPYLCQLLLGERQPSAELMLRIELITGIPMRAWLETVSVTDRQAKMPSENSIICKQLTKRRVS